ncbi:CD276 antigen isoform X1 [Xyrauchen texanus]|uniref:CD276 antigen isoform X1 n=2 Tax=Xyrauchen texanus TaxID=154827 RepID=UPI002241BF06|nr:CD276 antigen isoform X1 [Xyrauchen texanus]
MLWLILCVVDAFVASFEVSVPHKHLMAIRGHPAVLPCKFTPDPDLSDLVVTWQRYEDSRVVHSFYYQQDQLERQSPEYQNRTSLYISELGKGNASLKIAAVRQKDTGCYMCIVSNAKGSDKALLDVTYGALYSEPRLSIHVNSTTVTVQFETEGFPKPEVSWLGEQGQYLNHHLELYDQTEDGLYSMKSSYEVQKPVVNVTFTLKNHLLNQNLQRPVIISYDEDKATSQVIIAVIVLSMVCFLLIIGILLNMWRRNKQHYSL